jgi:diacylglycerol kinase family enzyme
MTGPHPAPSAPLVVVNPRASRLEDEARRESLVRDVTRAVEARTGQRPIIVGDSLDASQAALEALVDPPLVVAMGGDGTVRQAATVLAGRPIPLGIVPCGTGNVLAATLGVRGMASAGRALRHGTPRTIDVGSAEWGPPGATDPTGRTIFLVAVGMGLDARIMTAAQGVWKRHLGFMAYAGAMLSELTRLATADFAIAVDGERLDVHGHLALVANAGQIIPGLVGPREAIDPDDGLLDLFVVGGRGVLGGLRGGAELLLRRGPLDGFGIRRQVREVRIEAMPAQAIETDGDPHPPGWLAARVLPQALSVLVPPPRTAG